MDVSDMPLCPKVVPMEEREWFVLFSICVAGKSAKQTQEKVNSYLRLYGRKFTPFQVVQRDINAGVLDVALRTHSMGQYKRIRKAFEEVVKLDVTKDLTVEKLEAIPGIGPKTARFIVLYTNPDADCVPLDTHILKYLKIKYEHYEDVLGFKIPKSTPTKGPRYQKLEKLFQEEAKKQGKSVRQLDTEVWTSYAK